MQADAEPNTEGGPRAATTIRIGLKLALITQVLVAGLVVLTDVDQRWSLDQAFDRPPSTPSVPVSPGDQVRRHEPSRIVPRYADPGEAPIITLPDELPPRLSFTVEETDEHGRLLFINGPIVNGDAERFDAFLASLADMPDKVALNSPGGIVDEALTIGRTLRAQEATTIILPGMACVSACPYVLAGGVERHVSLRGIVGLHQHYYDAPAYMPVFFAVEDIQYNQGRTMEYLIEMGIDPAVMRFGLGTPPDDIYVLVEEELLDSAFASLVTN